MSNNVSPCVGICNLDADNMCKGCYRTLEEIQQWFTADEKAKENILQNVERRKQALQNEPER